MQFHWIALLLLPVLSALATQVAKVIAEEAKYPVGTVAAQITAAAFAYVIAHYPPLAPFVQLVQTAEGANITVALSGVLALFHDAYNALAGFLAWLQSLGATVLNARRAAEAARRAARGQRA